MEIMKWTKKQGTISIIQQRDKARAIIAISQRKLYPNMRIKNYYIIKERKSIVNEALKEVAEQAGLDEPITYEENGIKQTQPLYKLLHNIQQGILLSQYL